MFSLLPLSAGSEQRRRLLKLNRQMDRCHMGLTNGEISMLIETNGRALESTGRIELESTLPEALMTAFCDSPYLHREIFAETLCALTELFYHLKNETGDRIPDEELILLMRNRLDEPCKGSVSMLADLLGRGLH